MNFALHTRFGHVGRKSTNGGLFPVFKADYKRTAKVAVRALFRRELELELALTVHEVDEAARQEREAEDERWVDYESRQKAAARRNRNFLYRLGTGTVLWESCKPVAAFEAHLSEVWLLQEVCGDPYDDYDMWMLTHAWVGIDHTSHSWDVSISLPGGERFRHRYPLQDHCLEQLKAAVEAAMLLHVTDPL